MRAWWRKWWPVFKAVFAVAILLAVGRLFARDLRGLNLEERSLHPGWLAVSGLLYVLGLGLSAWFWFRLLRALGQRPSGLAAVRAYYVGHLGKYLPGKAWALIMRTTMIRGPAVRLGVAGLTTFYEVFTTMAGGVLLAACLFASQAREPLTDLDWRAVRGLFSSDLLELPSLDPRLAMLLALAMLVPVGVPLLPVVFNRLEYRLAGRVHDPDASPLPVTRTVHLLEGLLLTALGWLVLGASFWATLRAVLGDVLPWSWDILGKVTAILALSYVAGFLIPVPGGLGAREFFLRLLLVPELAGIMTGTEDETRKVAALAVVVLRLVWTAAELVVAGIVYWFPGPAVVRPGESP
jgi:uncharacterized membrane protein YbhN (UPF0104 family)